MSEGTKTIILLALGLIIGCSFRTQMLVLDIKHTLRDAPMCLQSASGEHK